MQRTAATRSRAGIAVMTAIFATVGAFCQLPVAGATQNDALLFKNEAAISRTEASDQWNFYPRRRATNRIFGGTRRDTLPPARSRMTTARKSSYYKKEKEKTMALTPRRLEQASRDADGKSVMESMHLHHRWAQSMARSVSATALAAITLLTRQKWLQHGLRGRRRQPGGRRARICSPLTTPCRKPQSNAPQRAVLTDNAALAVSANRRTFPALAHHHTARMAKIGRRKGPQNPSAARSLPVRFDSGHQTTGRADP